MTRRYFPRIANARIEVISLAVYSDKDDVGFHAVKNIQHFFLLALADSVFLQCFHGIIQNREIGVKERGYLEPRYAVQSSGGAITSW